MKGELDCLKPEELEREKVGYLQDISIALKILTILGAIGVSTYVADVLVRWVVETIK